MARMYLVLIACTTIGFWLQCPAASAQQQNPWRGSHPSARTGETPATHVQAHPARQPQPQRPHVRQPQSPAGQKPRAPFTLTQQQQAEVDAVLRAWEQQGHSVKTFACDFTRLEYDPVWGPADRPKFIDQGTIHYARPDKGRFEVEGQRPERWICDGKSIYAYDFQQQKLTEHQLPPELQGQAIADGPLPFLFGAKAEKLKQRYLMRLITPPDVQNQIWLEAYPRFQADAANFRKAEMILTADQMRPFALQLHLPNGKNRTVYKFDNIVVNDPFSFLKGDPFRASTPAGWTKVVQQPPQPATGQPATGQAANPAPTRR